MRPTPLASRLVLRAHLRSTSLKALSARSPAVSPHRPPYPCPYPCWVPLSAWGPPVRLGGRPPGGLGMPDCGDIVAGKSGWLRCVRANVAAARSVVSLARCCAALRRCSASHITLPGRLELPTLRLTASRSSQLSYGSLAPLVSLRAPARLAAEPEREGERGLRSRGA